MIGIRNLRNDEIDQEDEERAAQITLINLKGSFSDDEPWDDELENENDWSNGDFTYLPPNLSAE